MMDHMRRNDNFAPNYQNKNPTITTTTTSFVLDGKKREAFYSRSYSTQGQVHYQHSRRRMFPATTKVAWSYFSLESLLLLVCLTASLLILPLILPPLPPPPFMLLLLPIGILSVLMILAFMPSSSSSNVRDLTHTYV